MPQATALTPTSGEKKRKGWIRMKKQVLISILVGLMALGGMLSLAAAECNTPPISNVPTVPNINVPIGISLSNSANAWNWVNIMNNPTNMLSIGIQNNPTNFNWAQASTYSGGFGSPGPAMGPHAYDR
jgi:hypothetical protein